MNKAFWLVACLALVVPGVLLADEGPSVEAELRVQEGHIHPLLSREMHDTWVARQDVQLRLASGVFFGGWQSAALEHDRPSSAMADEGHLELGWSGEVCETATAVSTGVHNMPGSDDLLEQMLEWDVCPLYDTDGETWALRMRTAWVSTVNVSEGAVVVQPHVSHTWQDAFGCPAATLTQAFIASWDDGFEGAGMKNRSRGLFFRYEAALAWRLGEHTELVLPEFVGLFPLRAGHDGRGQRTEVSFGLRYEF